MSVTRSIYAPDIDIETLAQSLVAWYGSQNLEVEQLPGQTMVLQCRERQAWRKFAGMAMGLHVKLNYVNPGLIVTISASKWVDKAVIGGIAIALASSGIGLALAIPAAFGYWQQKKLPDRTFAFIEEAVASMGHPEYVPTPNNTNPQIRFSTQTPEPNKGSDANGRSDPIGVDGSAELSLVTSSFPLKRSKNEGSLPGNVDSSNLQRSAPDFIPSSQSTTGLASAASSAIACPVCGKPVTAGKSFCGKCGASLNSNDAKSARATQAKGTKPTGHKPHDTGRRDINHR